MPPVLIFDGECNLCCASVRLLAQAEGALRFAAYQSEAGRLLLARHGVPTDEVESVVLVQDDGSVTRGSSAALRSLAHLEGMWRFGAHLERVPKPLREGAYGFVSRHRHRWFGRRSACIPPPGKAHRFL